MKELTFIALCALLPLTAFAGDQAMKDDPHHQGKGACANKEKSAHWKRLHDQAVQRQQEQQNDQFNVLDQQEVPQRTVNLDRFI